MPLLDQNPRTGNMRSADALQAAQAILRISLRRPLVKFFSPLSSEDSNRQFAVQLETTPKPFKTKLRGCSLLIVTFGTLFSRRFVSKPHRDVGKSRAAPGTLRPPAHRTKVG